MVTPVKLNINIVYLKTNFNASKKSIHLFMWNIQGQIKYYLIGYYSYAALYYFFL